MCESLLIETALHVIHGLHAETLPALSLETLHIGAYKGLHALPLIRKYLLQKLFFDIVLRKDGTDFRNGHSASHDFVLR